MKIINIYELDKIEDYLKIRNLLNQYIKAKKFILLWDSKVVDLKLREPKNLGIYYFRINKQYRAHARLEWNNLIVFKIDNHQN